MINIYSTNFYAGTPPEGFLELYTVPQPLVMVVRDIELLNTGGLTETFSIFADVSGAGSATIFQVAAASLTWYQWTGRAVLPASSVLNAHTPTGGTMQLLVSGYLLGS